MGRPGTDQGVTVWHESQSEHAKQRAVQQVVDIPVPSLQEAHVLEIMPQERLQQLPVPTGTKQVRRAILREFKKLDYEESIVGLNALQLMALLPGVSDQAMRSTFDAMFLINGEVYNTIDEEHFALV